MDRAELVANILDESERPDLAAQMPRFIRRVESMIATDLRAVEMVKLATLNDADRASAGSATYDLPSDFLEDRSFIVAGRPLRKFSRAGLEDFRESGRPMSYALHAGGIGGLQITIRGNPAPDSLVQMEYFARPAPLVLPGDTNRLLQQHESVYHYGALFALYSFTQDLALAESSHTIWKDFVDKINEQAGRFVGGAGGRPAYNLGHIPVGRGY